MSRILKLPFVLAATAFATTASAALIGAALQGAIRPPTDIRDNMTQNDAGIRGMDELQNTTFSAIPDFGIALVAGEHYVDCHVTSFDPLTQPLTRTARFRFDGEIIGVITDSDTLDTFDALCDPGLPMIYPAPGDEDFRGLDPLQTPADSVQVFQNAAGRWNQIEITAEVTSWSDQVRVITCVDASESCHALAASVGWGGLVMP